MSKVAELSTLSGELAGHIKDIYKCLDNDYKIYVDSPPTTVYGHVEHPQRRTDTVVVTFTLIDSEKTSGNLHFCTYRVTQLQGL